ncbi:SAM-dependent methyltransferase [Salinifilum ghardaiensis]
MGESALPPSEQPHTGVDGTVPHSARLYNYWLGGKDHYAVDREAGEQYERMFPGITQQARDSRSFLARAVRYLVDECGIRQFLDIGTGLPTAENTHEIAQRCAPESRIVYVDNDPLVLTHARALLASTPAGATDYLDADLRDPATILRRAAETLDLTRPVGLLFIAVLGHMPDHASTQTIVHQLLGALPVGSYLVINDATNTNPEHAQAQDQYNSGEAVPYRLHTPDQFAELFQGLELIEPGIVPTTHWHAHTAPPTTIPASWSTRAAIGYKTSATPPPTAPSTRNRGVSI